MFILRDSAAISQGFPVRAQRLQIKHVPLLNQRQKWSWIRTRELSKHRSGSILVSRQLRPWLPEFLLSIMLSDDYVVKREFSPDTNVLENQMKQILIL